MFWVLAVLLLIAAGYTHYSFYKRSSIDVAKLKFESYLNRTQSEIEGITADVDLLQSLLSLYEARDSSQKDIERALNLSTRPYTIFIYDQANKLIYWSNDHAPQPNLDLFNLGSSYYSPLQSLYHTILKSQKIGTNIYKILACIPIRIGGTDEPYRHIDKNLPATLQLSTTVGVPIIASSGEEIIYISNSNFDRLTKREVRILLILYGLAFLALAVLIQKIAYLIKKRIGTWTAIGFFLFTSIGIRLASYLFDFTNQFSSSEVFDSTLTQPAFTNSLGNILINIVLILWISVFLVNNVELQKTREMTSLQKVLLSFGGYLVIAFGILWLAKFCQNLIQETSIDFNFESVFNLDKISILALIGIILLLFSLFIWSAKIVSVIQQSNLAVRPRIISGLSAILASMLIAFVIGSSIPIFQFAIVVGIFILLLDIFLEVKTPNFTWIVLWLVVLSGFSSILMFKYNRDKDIAQRTEIAKALSEGADTVAFKEILALIEVMEELLNQVSSWNDLKNIITTTYANNTSGYFKHAL